MFGKVKVGLAVVAILATAATGVNAAYVDGFEGYDAGSVIQGQGDFIYWNNTEDLNSHAFVSDVMAYSGAKSLRLGGHAAGLYTDPVWQFANVETGVSSVNSGKWVLKQMVYIPSATNGTGYVDFNYMSRHGTNPPIAPDWGGGLPHFEMRAGNADQGKITGSGITTPAPIIFDQWVEFRMEVDFDVLPRAQAQYFYNGVAIGALYDWDDDPVQLAGIDYWSPAGTGPVYLDDLSLVPEPATLWLLGLGGLCLLTYARRRRR